MRIRQAAVGVNYIDVYVRSGLYRMIEPPAPLGMEAAGVVVDVGDGVAHLLPGDRVAYACAPPGAYVGVRTMPADPGRRAPGRRGRRDRRHADAEGHDRGYLLHRTHRVRAGETVLVHAAAGGVGLLLCQWARALRRQGHRHRLERGQGAARARRMAASSRSSAGTIGSRPR